MKKYLSLFLISLSLSNHAFAASRCFIVQENGKVLKQEGICTQRTAPASTFKIPISLMGFSEGILEDELHPEWPYLNEYNASLEVHRQAHNPATWMKNSPVWYSRIITQKLGMSKFKKYVQRFNYGNQDISGDNSLSQAWLSAGSLKISPIEQIAFLEKFTNAKLPVSQKAFFYTHKILFLEALPGRWMLYGKTGSGNQFHPDGQLNENLKTGWFVGWLEKDNRKILFAQYIEDEQPNAQYGGARAKEEAIHKLKQMLETL